MQPNTSAYINPFGSSATHGMFSVKPPLLADFDDFDIGVDDSSSDFADYNAQLQKRKQQMNQLEARSEGEIADLDASQESLGEIIPKS